MKSVPLPQTELISLVTFHTVILRPPATTQDSICTKASVLLRQVENAAQGRGVEKEYQWRTVHLFWKLVSGI